MTGYGRARLERASVISERVHLRPIAADDASAAFALIHGQPAITDWIEWDGPARVEELEESYAAWPTDTEEMTGYMFAVIERASGDWAGSVDVRHMKEHPVATLGYLIGSPFQGRGLATEAVGHLVQLAFEELSVLLVRAEVFEGNQASIRVLEKSGLRREEGREISCEKRGVQVTKHVYSISRVEWELSAPARAAWQVSTSRAD